jgi:cation diffusion facilitator family transporter
VNIDGLYRRARRMALWGIAANLGLGLLKLAGGILGHSMALVSDAVHSLGDALTATGVWGALLWAQRPADREHPYGHTRAEAVAGSSVALLLIVSGLAVGWEAFHTLDEPSPAPAGYTLVIAAVSLVLKEGLYRYGRRVAAETDSVAVRAAAWDHRLDALGSLAVLVGLALATWGGSAWHAADHVAALVVALVILWAGAALYWASLHELMDRQADADLLAAVRREALAVPGVRGVEKLLARKTGLEYLVDIHVEVDPELSVRDGHAIAHEVKDRLLHRLVRVKDVLVHIEPAGEVSGRAPALRGDSAHAAAPSPDGGRP